MISMGKSGGVYGSGNTGLPQAFSGGRKTQNNQKSIFGAKNKSSVTDIRRMLARDDRNGQMQAANSWSQDSIVTSSLSYSESLRDQRQQTKNTTLALKKLKYQSKYLVQDTAEQDVPGGKAGSRAGAERSPAPETAEAEQ